MEKLAILRRHLQGECADVVHGLGGGKVAYIEALTRLKETYGRRNVMRAAILQAMEKLEIGRQVPFSFRQLADQTRTYIFDLNRIRETAAADIIERVCLKPQFPERIAWNEGRLGGIETWSLLNFDRLL